MSQDTNNPVFKFTTDNLQLNVLIRSIFEHYGFASDAFKVCWDLK